VPGNNYVVEIFFHPEARAEYLAAEAWYRERSLRAAARFEAEVEHLLGLIRTNPEMFPPYDEDNRFAVLDRYPYTLIYQGLPGVIQIVAVAHSSRSAGYWQGRTFSQQDPDDQTQAD
jgi:plasmid stabilization system protein ParE